MNQSARRTTEFSFAHQHTQLDHFLYLFAISYPSYSPGDATMAADTLLKALAMVCLLVGTTLSMPSFDSGSFDDGSLLNLNGILTPRSEPFEIRGVYGGRKKRYIVERKAACCRQKPLCLPTLGQFIKECKCEKCPTGIPALDGLSCTENCPEGTVTTLDPAAPYPY
jgi:hypothetical protein